MQDKFSIGPVTIVQLVGLTAKPRIASAQADGAVRAADTGPPSAAAGLGDELSHAVAEIAPSYLNLKAEPALNITADPLAGHIAFESGVDRPATDTSAPPPTFDPPDFNELPNPGQPRNPDLSTDGSTSGAPAINDSTTGDPAGVIGGLADDEVLDFTVPIPIGAMPSLAASGGMENDGDDWLPEFSADQSIGGPFDAHSSTGDFGVPEAQLWTSDAVPPM